MANITSNPKETVCEDVKPIQNTVRQGVLVNTVLILRGGHSKVGNFLGGSETTCFMDTIM
jgi:hypothetical protein